MEDDVLKKGNAETAKGYAEAAKGFVEAAEGVKNLIGKPYGLVKRREECIYEGQKAALVWDHIIWNEITREVNGEKISEFTSMDAQETEKKFEELLKKYTQK